MVTIKQVAKLAGVSPTTASYALNGRMEVKEATRERVLAAAESLNYVPNKVAQSFRNGRTRTITVITAEEIENANTFTAEFFGVLAEARSHHYDVLVKLEAGAEISTQQAKALFGNHTSDGFILLGNLPETYMQHLTESKACGVLLSSHSMHPIVQVNSDGRRGIYSMTIRAIESGKLSPAYLTFSAITVEERLRCQGFLDALSEKNIDETNRVHICGTQAKEISACVEKCINCGIDCFICWNDVLAHMVLEVLRNLEIAVPQQVAVTGYDDIEPTSGKSILTTVHQPFFEKGQFAVQLLLKQINGSFVEPKEYFVDCEIVLRESL